MKIVAIDNFGRDWIPEHVEEEGLTEKQAGDTCTLLNAGDSPRREWFYVVRADDAAVRTLEDIYG